MTDKSHQSVDKSEKSNQKIVRKVKEWRELYIIGNGFDLECGLRSSFSDFENEYVKYIDLSHAGRYINGHDWVEKLIQESITIWDILLHERHEYFWSDVESAIRESVVGGGGNAICSTGAEHLSMGIRMAMQDQEVLGFTQRWSFLLSEEKRYVVDKSVCKRVSSYDELILYYLIRLLKDVDLDLDLDNEIMTTKALYKVMLDQLHVIEKRFTIYLKDELKRNSAYYKNARALLFKMQEFDRQNENEYKTTISVLNFNYTDPLFLIKKSAGRKNLKRAINIHGSIDEGDIVFGMDGMGYISNENILPFTKTYRLMIMKNNIYRDVLAVSDDNGYITRVNVIKFYGHSLASADYSYFQSIFDDIDLYGGQTVLIFFYRPPKDIDGERGDSMEARNSMVKKVVRLIDNYGQSLDNKEHGKNLLHKLLIEGRLKVVYLPETSKQNNL